jgi:hypothetical protein
LDDDVRADEEQHLLALIRPQRRRNFLNRFKSALPAETIARPEEIRRRVCQSKKRHFRGRDQPCEGLVYRGQQRLAVGGGLDL